MDVFTSCVKLLTLVPLNLQVSLSFLESDTWIHEKKTSFIKLFFTSFSQCSHVIEIEIKLKAPNTSSLVSFLLLGVLLYSFGEIV
jgi:hypothetical protein